jgi:hypothetical protein
LSLVLKEEHTLRVFENGVPRRIFGPKREEITDWTKIRNGDLCSTYGEEGKYRETSGKDTWA